MTVPKVPIASKLKNTFGRIHVRLGALGAVEDAARDPMQAQVTATCAKSSLAGRIPCLTLVEDTNQP